MSEQPISDALSGLKEFFANLFELLGLILGYFSGGVWDFLDAYIPTLLDNPAFQLCVIIAVGAAILSFWRPVLAGIPLVIALTEAYYQHTDVSMLTFLLTDFSYAEHQVALLEFGTVMLKIALWYAVLRYLVGLIFVKRWRNKRAQSMAEVQHKNMPEEKEKSEPENSGDEPESEPKPDPKA